MKEHYKICASVCPDHIDGLGKILEEAFQLGADLVEIRFDYMKSFSVNDVDRIVDPYIDRCIFTCRPNDQGGRFDGCEEDRVRLLLSLLDLSPKYVDFELTTFESYGGLADKAKGSGSSLISSWHNFDHTPDDKFLKSIMQRCLNSGDYGKIVTTARSMEDNFRILSLYRYAEKGRVISFCMGELGVVSRILAPILGAPFMFAAVGYTKAAPGQMDIKELRAFYDLLQELH